MYKLSEAIKETCRSGVGTKEPKSLFSTSRWGPYGIPVENLCRWNETGMTA